MSSVSRIFPSVLCVFFTCISACGTVASQGEADAGDGSGDGGKIGDGKVYGPIEGRPCQADMDCQTDSPCETGVCVQAKCRLQPGPSGFICDDGDVCTLHDHCEFGVCIGKTLGCSDGNTCTLDGCDAHAGCTHTPTNQVCNEGDPCTNYTCDSGSCVASGSACDDGNPCTLKDCTSLLGCRTFALSGPVCDDGNPCTLGDLCTFGACTGSGECNDHNFCTADSCVEGGGCKHENIEQICSDGEVCTGFDHCVSGVCTGTFKTCDDGNPCTSDACDKTNAICINTPILEGGACDDGNPCTFNTICVASVCAGQNKNCADGDPCTDDKCVFPSGQCLHTTAFGCK